jgi:hypothetical protein
MSLWLRWGLFALAMMLILCLLVLQDWSVPLRLLLLLVLFGFIRLILGPMDLQWFHGPTAVTPDDSAATPNHSAATKRPG